MRLSKETEILKKMDVNTTKSLLDNCIVAINKYNEGHNSYRMWEGRTLYAMFFLQNHGDDEKNKIAIVYQRINVDESSIVRESAKMVYFYLVVVPVATILPTNINEVTNYDVKELIFIKSYFKEHPNSAEELTLEYYPEYSSTQWDIEALLFPG